MIQENPAPAVTREKRASRWISTALNGILAVCAVTVTGLLVRRELFPAAAAAAPAQQTRAVMNWQQYAATGHRLGSADAPVTVVVFSDFQCPACRMLAGYLKAIRAENPQQVSVVVRHSPLPNHPFAVAAARASECAARQGRFEAFHDALFVDQPAIGLAPWSRFAATAGVPDIPAFDRCVSDPAPVTALERDTADARSLNVESTPTLIINGTELQGTPPLEILKQHIQRAARAAAPGAGGTENAGSAR